jgi:heme-degrading monooxygenase HmoA
MPQITTLTFFNYTTFTNKVWAFGMMQFAHAPLKKVNGLQLYKLMGSGKGTGFNPWPDWGTYALLQIWDNEQAAADFFANSALINKYKAHCSNHFTVYLKNITAKGLWNGVNPFVPSTQLDDTNTRVAIITRATIKPKKLRTFWAYVPTSEKHLLGAKGLEFTKGIGEAPLVQMATFSIWQSLQDMQAFAYKGHEHRVAIQKTRELDWYTEEMFARFQVVKIDGEWL